MPSDVFTTGGIAALISAVTGIATWQLAHRAQLTAQRRQDAIDRAPYIEQLQAWSWRTIQEAEQRAKAAERECDERIKRERADCADRIRGVREDADHKLRDLQAQVGARVLAAERREDYWRRAYNGELGEGERPPPPRRST